MRQIPKDVEEKMKTSMGLVLLFAALAFSSIGQVFADGTPSFDITTNCYDLTYPIDCGPVTVTVSSVNGFSGTVGLTTSVTTYCTNCSLTATLNPTSVNVPSGGYATSSLTITTSCHLSQSQIRCMWDITITGTSGSISNSTDVFVCVGNLCPI